MKYVQVVSNQTCQILIFIFAHYTPIIFYDVTDVGFMKSELIFIITIIIEKINNLLKPIIFDLIIFIIRYHNFNT